MNTLKKLNKNSHKIIDYLILQGCNEEYKQISCEGLANDVKMNITSVTTQLNTLVKLGYISKISACTHKRSYKFYVIKDKIEE